MAVKNGKKNKTKNVGATYAILNGVLDGLLLNAVFDGSKSPPANDIDLDLFDVVGDLDLTDLM